MTRAGSGGARPGAGRRAVLGAGVAVCLAGLQRPAIAAAPASGGLADVLDRPAPVARVAASAPMLRLARCGRRLVAVGERGLVLLSDDDGQRWRQAQVPVSVSLTGVQFTSERRGYAIGHGGVVLRSDDAGQTWQRLLDGRRIAALLTDPGQARQAEADGPDKPWLALHFGDDLNGRVVGAFGLALETADGGRTWRSFANRLANPRSLHLYAVQRHDEQVWIGGEQGFFATSVDGGRHFSVVPTPYRGSFFALLPLDDGSALLGGLRGTLLQHSGGDTFRPVTAASAQGVVQLLPLPSQSLALVDQSGRLFTASATELRFKSVAVSPARNWLGVVQAADGVFVGASLDGVARLQPSLPKT